MAIGRGLGRGKDWRKSGEEPEAIARGVVLAAQGKNEEALVPLQTARALGVSLLVQGDAELHLSSFDILEV